MKRWIIVYLKDGNESSFNLEAPNFELAMRKSLVKIALEYGSRYEGVQGLCIVEMDESFEVAAKVFTKV